MNLRINIADNLTPRVAMLMRVLTGAGRVEMMRAAGAELQELTRDHIGALKRKGGSLASRKGAPASGFYKQAAQEVSGPEALSASSNEAVLTITARGFVRAFRDVEVRPQTARALAIPIHPDAFGHRAAELWDRLGLFIPKGGRAICGMIGGVVTPFYALAKRVVQRQDRSLLPGDESFQAAAQLGVQGYLGQVLGQRGV